MMGAYVDGDDGTIEESTDGYNVTFVRNIPASPTLISTQLKYFPSLQNRKIYKQE